LLTYFPIGIHLTAGVSAVISLERNSYSVIENGGFVEVCAILESLEVVEGGITVDIHTSNISATGKMTVKHQLSNSTCMYP